MPLKLTNWMYAFIGFYLILIVLWKYKWNINILPVECSECWIWDQRETLKKRWPSFSSMTMLLHLKELCFLLVFINFSYTLTSRHRMHLVVKLLLNLIINNLSFDGPKMGKCLFCYLVNLLLTIDTVFPNG